MFNKFMNKFNKKTDILEQEFEQFNKEFKAKEDHIEATRKRMEEWDKKTKLIRRR